MTAPATQDVHRSTAAALLAVVALACPLHAAAPDEAEAPTQLPDLTVTAPADPWMRERHQLRRRLERQTPCLGCDGVDRETRSLLKDLFNKLVIPKPMDSAERMQKRLAQERNFNNQVHGTLIDQNLTVSRDLDAFERQQRILAGELSRDSLLDYDAER